MIERKENKNRQAHIQRRKDKENETKREPEIDR